MRNFLVAVICLFLSVADCFAVPYIIDKPTGKKILNSISVSHKDLQLYKHIFRDIEKEDIQAAKEKIDDLDNKILLGHVWAEIYLSKTYVSSLKELTKWLKKYSDHPQARTIYQLAVSKNGNKTLENPWGEKYPIIYSPYSWFSNQYEMLSDENRQYVRRQVSLFRQYINKGKTKAARALLENSKFRKIIPDKEYDAMSVTLATVYLLDNQNRLAWQWVQKATRRSDLAMGYWIGGLAAWQLKQYQNAGKFFAKLAAKYDSDEWLVAAGGYWAYRSYHRIKKETEARKWLQAAAVYKRTFYGMLAAYQIGEPWHYNWEGFSFFNDYTTDDYLEKMLSSPAICRALVLLQAKNKELAEKEIRVAYKSMDRHQKEALLFIAQQYEMHSLVILLANDIKDNESGVFYDEAAYPVPNWKPRHGWKIDEAFVWALVRQESAFYPKANSRVGAKGLMQLMPATAFHITKNPKIKQNSEILFKTDYNLELGQRYVQYLAEKPFINKNMLYTIAAYNAGPGNLYKWQKKVPYGDDPLLFIEIIPARETRIYIERVMANYWMYEARFNKNRKSLERLIAGKWPTL